MRGAGSGRRAGAGFTTRAFAAFWLAFGHALLVGTDLKGFGGPVTAILAAAPVLWLSFYRLLVPRALPARAATV